MKKFSTDPRGKREKYKLQERTGRAVRTQRTALAPEGADRTDRFPEHRWQPAQVTAWAQV